MPIFATLYNETDDRDVRFDCTSYFQSLSAVALYNETEALANHAFSNCHESERVALAIFKQGRSAEVSAFFADSIKDSLNNEHSAFECVIDAESYKHWLSQHAPNVKKKLDDAGISW